MSSHQFGVHKWHIFKLTLLIFVIGGKFQFIMLFNFVCHVPINKTTLLYIGLHQTNYY